MTSVFPSVSTGDFTVSPQCRYHSAANLAHPGTMYALLQPFISEGMEILGLALWSPHCHMYLLQYGLCHGVTFIYMLES